MEVGAMNNILAQLPIDTKLLRFNLGSDEKIQEMEVSDLSDITANDIHAATIILTSYMSAFGVDTRSIGKGLIEDTTNAIVDLRNLLINADWENTTIKINGETTTAIDYIKSAFNIFNKTDFVNGLFRNLVDLALNSEVNGENTVISADSETYNMMKLIAYCWGTNNDFTKEIIGDEQIINIPLDLENIADTFTFIGNLLIDKGYVAESLRDNFTLSDSAQYLLNPVTGATGDAWNNNIGFNNNGDFKYLHCYIINSIINTNQHVWTPILFATKKEIKPIVFEQASVGFNNLSGYVGYLAHLYDKTTNAEDMTKAYMVWYGRNHGNDSGSTYQNMWYDMGTYTQIWSDGELINGCDEANNVYYNGGLGTGNSVSRNELGTYVKFPIRRWNSVYVSSDFEEVILNNQYDGTLITSDPTIDSRVEGKIDNDLIDLISYFLIYPIIITPSSIQAILHPNNNPINTGKILKTDTIDISLNVSLIDGTPLETILEDLDQAYNPEFSSTIHYENAGMNFIKRTPNIITYRLGTDDSVNKFVHNLWDVPAPDLANINLRLFDCVKKIYALPFKLMPIDMSKGALGNDIGEYNPTQYYARVGTVEFNGVGTNNREVWINRIDYPIRIMTTKPVFVGNVVKKDGKKQPAFGNFLDYTATKASVYIPFVGEKEIDINMIMYRYVFLEYCICITTGDFISTLYSYRFKDHKKDCYKYASPDKRFRKSYPVISAQGNLAFEYPIVGRESANAINALSNGIGAVSSLFSLNVGGMAQGILNTATALQPGNVMTKGAVENVHAYMANWKPYITIMKQEAIRGYSDESKASAFNQILGLKSERGIKIKHMENGFHKLRGVKLDGLRCTETERQELQQIMMDGFYTSIKKT